MSGHSKWSKVKHQKAVTDAVKGKAFTRASRGITIAVKEGGGMTNPDHNFKLRLAIELARAVNMPKDNIERAIEKGAGGEGSDIEQLVYEGYGPHGVAFIVEAATDNRQRIVSQVKNMFDRAGGSLASPGAVSYLFSKNGLLTVPKAALPFDQIMEYAIQAGASDVIETDDVVEVYTSVAALFGVKHFFEEHNVPIETARLIMRPLVEVAIEEAARERIDALQEALEALDDVQEVYTNIL